MVINKTCYKRKKSKESFLFAKDSRAKDGLQSKCKECDSKYRLENCTSIALYKFEWNKNPNNNSSAIKAAYKKDNPGKINALKAKRKAAKLQRTPKWLTSLHLEHIEMFYASAAALTKEFGISMQVDHIVPLQGKNVSGLHVPWNLQVITAQENAYKGNR